jgi:hypothetical protein
MSRLESIGRFAELPEFGQALIAVRMVERAVKGKLPEGDPERELILKACAAAQQCAHDGQGTYFLKDLFRQVMNLLDAADSPDAPRGNLRMAAWYMIDAINAAEAAQEFAIDGTATRSARKSLAALQQDRELNGLQMLLLLSGDVDQVHFACEEDRRLPSQNLAAKHQGLGAHVMGRMAPVHALTVTPYQPTGEEAVR